jgi:hypothetical protein
LKLHIDPRSETWRFIESWATERLEKTRSKNDSMAHDAIQTAALRGRIGELKDLLALTKDPVIEADDSGPTY